MQARVSLWQASASIDQLLSKAPLSRYRLSKMRQHGSDWRTRIVSQHMGSRLYLPTETF